MAELTIQQTLALAVQHHQAGRLAQAEAIYRQVLAQQPNHPDALHLLGLVAGQCGHLDMASNLIHQAIAAAPDNPDYHGNLGNLLLSRGQLDQAIACFQRVTALKPDLPQAHNNLGAVLVKKGQLDQAIACFQRALALKGDYADAFINLGAAWMGKRELDQAIACYQRALAIQPDYPETHNNLGNAWKQKGQWDQAVACFQRALEIKPDYSEAFNNLGNVRKDMGQLDQAVACYRQALAINPDLFEAHNNLGAVLLKKGQSDQAIACHRRALAIQPRSPETLVNLGIALEHAGDLPEAEQCYRQVLEREKNNAAAHAKLATLLGRKLPDNDLIALQAVLGDPFCNVASQASVHFAAAHVLDARQRYREADEHMRLAHSLCKTEAERKGEAYDVAAHVHFITRMIDACSAEFFRRVHGMGLQTQRPVFIIGLPRSGTSLTEQILAGHSQVFAAGELPFGQDDFQSLAGESARTMHPNLRMDRAFGGLSRLDHQTIQNLAHTHLLELDKLNGSAARIIDKRPGNYFYLGLLAALFPQAKFIHCRRDLRDTAISCWMTPFEDITWSNDLEHITTRFEQYRRLMWHWGNVLPGRWLDCDYEQTVADLPGTARRLVDWCGLEWEPACVDFHRVKRPVRTASLTQVRQPIYNHSVGRWTHYQDLLAPVLDRLS